ncbi:MAG: CheR family methyltransferase [Acidiferrobacter sp.]
MANKKSGQKTTVAQSKRVHFPIVGIGASAGGLEAFTQLLAHLPVDTGMGFVLVQHLAPTQPSALVHLLSAVTAMPVLEAVDKQRVLPNHVYVIAPNTALRIARGTLKVEAREQSPGVQRAIDNFLESLALDRGEQAIGVILSGNASDDTLGLEAIKAHGGIALAQDASAQYHSMPNNAVAAGCVDLVLAPQDIALELARMARHPYVARNESPLAESPRPPETIASAHGLADRPGLRLPETEGQGIVGIGGKSDLGSLLQLVRTHSGVDFSFYKSVTIERRISRRMVLNRITSLAEYVRFLGGNTRELDQLSTDMLIGVTRFFRDPEAIEALQRDIFPALLQFPRSEPLRVWVPGCSTGQEAYSLGMAFTEFFERAGQTRTLQMFATDLDETRIDKARAALYPETLVHEIGPERLRRFFVKQTGGYRVIKELREQIVFARHNLLSDPPFSGINLISCRNVMIYLEPPVQKRLLAVFHYALKPQGYLFLGTSESMGTATDRFESVDKKHKIYKKRSGVAARLPAPVMGGHRRDIGRKRVAPLPPTGAPRTPLPEWSAQREADRVAVKRFAPPGVLINADLEIIQFRGATNPYLGLPSHKASFHLLSMARDDLRQPLRAAIDKAMKDNKVVRRVYHPVAYDGVAHPPVTLEVIPLKNIKEPHYLVVFDGLVAVASDAVVTTPDRQTTSARGGQKEGLRRVQRLQQELDEAQDYAQALQEQYEAANEELQATNEEAQSAVEELQSTNEQLETSQEEVDSANEELITVNEEMVRRNVEMSRLNDDLNNLQVSVNLPMVVLARDLRVRSFTPRAAPLFNLLVSDIGQSINGIQHRLDCPELARFTAAAIDTVSAQEHEVRDRDGRWYLLRIQPYVTLDNKIDGVVLVLVDIDALKRSTLETQRALLYAEAMLRTARVPLVALHGDLRVNTANEAFYKTFNLSAAEVEGHSMFALSNGAWDIPELRTLLLEILPRDSVFNDFQVIHVFPTLGRRTMWLNARRMQSVDDAAEMIVLSIEDVTERLDAHETVRRSEIRFRRLCETTQDGILILEPASGKISDANPFITELLGYTRDELIGKGLGEIGLLHDEASSHEALAQLRKTGYIRYDNLPLQGKDGQLHAVEFVSNIYEEEGSSVIQCNIRDVTARTRAVEALHASEARFHAIADNVPVMIWVRDPDNRVTYFNRGWQAFVGGADDQAKNNHWQDAIHPDDRARCLDDYARAFTDHKRFELKYRLRQHGGDYRLILDVGIPLMLGGRFTGYIGSCLDMTEREQRDAELSKSSKLESIGILAGGIAHDFNNLLTAIIGNIGLARFSVDPNGELFESLMAAETAGLRARDLAQQLLIFARGGALIQNVLSLGGLLAEWVAFALCGSNIKITSSIAPDLWLVEADAGQLSQVINNLIINAQQAMPQGGVVTVTAENVTLAADNGLPLVGDYVCTAITDQGGGIAKDHLAKIFDPFFTTKSKGTGLGLATSYAIVERHRGHLTVQSELGRGTTFYIYLPASLKKMGPVADSRNVPTSGTGKILFMDDEPVIRRFAGTALASFGYQVECVEDGDQAVARYQLAIEQGAPYCGVILDLTVPGGMGGKETMQALLLIDSKVQAIVSSGYSNDPIMADFAAYGFCGRIAKPYQLEELRDAVSLFGRRA